MIAVGQTATMEEYIDQVMGEEITVCAAVRGAVVRHLEDLKREGTDEFPYYFDEQAAAKIIGFFPRLNHSIGEFAGMPFHLEPWQAFGVGCLMGWKRVKDDTRRFRRAYWSVARKNGKSSLAAGLALYLAGFDINPIKRVPEPVAEVLLVASKREQVDKVIFKEVQRMRLGSPQIEQQSEYKKYTVTFFPSEGSIRTIGSERPFSGLNPHGCILDELHEWRDYHQEFYDTMLTGSGLRLQPLVFEVTTAGNDKSELWLAEYKYSRAVALGEITDDTVFAYSFEIDPDDDPLDPDVWVKANPIITSRPQFAEYLQEQAARAGNNAIELNKFTRYHGNRIVTSIDSAFAMDQWDRCQGELSDWSQADAIGAGIDLGGRDDLAAFALCARFPIGEPGEDETPTYRYELRTWCYIAADTQRDLSLPPFAQWVQDRHLKVVKYPVSALRDQFLMECERHYISTVAFDPANGAQIAEDLEQMLGKDRVGRMAQTARLFNEPIRDLLQSITDGRLIHDGDPVLRWCASNAVLINQRQEEVMYDKRSSREKIDAVVASTMAYRMAMVAKPRSIGLLCDDREINDNLVRSPESAIEDYARRLFE